MSRLAKSYAQGEIERESDFELTELSTGEEGTKLEKHYTACCGLYCLDCIPANEKLFEVVGTLDRMLAELNFTRYAEYKAQGNAVFADYPTFSAVLQAIMKLKCKALCCDGGAKDGCLVRQCVHEKEITGCWECAGSRECELLAPLKANHVDLEHNLAMIREYGIERWMQKRGRHYRWDKMPRKG